MCAGIGGFHLAFSRAGAECVFAAENDPYARKTYEANFRATCPKLFDGNLFAHDITTVDPASLPDFDILAAGFPCQPFSIAGKRKGFADTRGTLFFTLAEILRVKQPKAFFLENVRGLLSHDGGKTFETIRTVLTKDLGYFLFYKIVKASDYDLPQHRPRLFMIGFRDKSIQFEFPKQKPLRHTLSDVFEGHVSRAIGYTLRVGGRGAPITDRRNWDGYIVDGILRRVSVKEAKRMQGFPEEFVFPVSQTQAMKQLGNAVAVDATVECAKQIFLAISLHLSKNS